MSIRRHAPSKNVNHRLATVLRIPDQSLADRIDYDIESFQRDLADQNRAIVWDFRHVCRELPPKNSPTDGRSDRCFHNPCHSPCHSPDAASPIGSKAQFGDKASGKRTQNRSRVDDGVRLLGSVHFPGSGLSNRLRHGDTSDSKGSGVFSPIWPYTGWSSFYYRPFDGRRP